jgi:hypothetical protein
VRIHEQVIVNEDEPVEGEEPARFRFGRISVVDLHRTQSLVRQEETPRCTVVHRHGSGSLALDEHGKWWPARYLHEQLLLARRIAVSAATLRSTSNAVV